MLRPTIFDYYVVACGEELVKMGENAAHVDVCVFDEEPGVGSGLQKLPGKDCLNFQGVTPEEADPIIMEIRFIQIDGVDVTIDIESLQ